MSDPGEFTYSSEPHILLTKREWMSFELLKAMSSGLLEYTLDTRMKLPRHAVAMVDALLGALEETDDED